MENHSLVKMQFFEKYWLPGIVDGVLIRVRKPADVFMKNEFICRKKFPAVNCQMCCGPDNDLPSQCKVAQFYK